MLSPFPCSLVIRECSWKKTQLEKKTVCGMAKLGPLGSGHLHHLMFITELLFLWSVGHIDPHITGWVTKPIQVSLTWQPTNLSSSYTFQFSVCILSFGCQKYNYSSWVLKCPEVPKKANWLRRSMLNIYLKWLIGL